jgi:hypothetical protein
VGGRYPSSTCDEGVKLAKTLAESANGLFTSYPQNGVTIAQRKLAAHIYCMRYASSGFAARVVH